MPIRDLEGLKNRRLNVVVPRIEPPYVNYLYFTDHFEDELGYTPGIVWEILRDVGRSLNLTYHIDYLPKEEWGVYINGNWTGAFGRLVRGEADIIAGAATMDFDRSLVADLTYPLDYQASGFLLRKPEQYVDYTWAVITESFSWKVWLATFVCITLSALAYRSFATVMERHNEERRYTFLQATWKFFSIFAQQSLVAQPKSWTCRTMVGLWWLCSMTLCASFTASLVALFAVEQRTRLPFQTIEQMVKAIHTQKYTLLVDATATTRTQMIKHSQLKPLQDLWFEMSVNHRVKYVDDLQQGIELVKKEPGYVLMGPMETLRLLATTECDAVVLKEGVLPTYLAIPIRKGSEYVHYISERYDRARVTSTKICRAGIRRSMAARVQRPRGCQQWRPLQCVQRVPERAWSARAKTSTRSLLVPYTWDHNFTSGFSRGAGCTKLAGALPQAKGPRREVPVGDSRMELTLTTHNRIRTNKPHDESKERSCLLK